ncbi:glycosyltransferase family 2 protein [Roseomonas populi]|uniref:Glycosyltransferase n=1 Tax=Roseomonas populi TaxID=3121582 RepID=A0ABT1X2I8_9PROT|nr:glycosyltransferase [Roseomonas pecuniae]MCR0982319.1 glycosyltransferase [Roseomonas pecuniae]
MSAPVRKAGDVATGEYDVSVVIPTFRRPHLLRRSLEAVQAQSLWLTRGGEILVVDNCPNRSAEPVVAALPVGDVPVRYLAEPRPGISHARNSGVSTTKGGLIVFIDDDNLTVETAIGDLVAALEETNASAAFGRYIALPEAACPPNSLHFIGPYSRDLGATRRDVTRERAKLGTCLSLFRRSALAKREQLFDPALGLTGGEDSALLRELAQEGHRFVYEPSAVGFEIVALSRLNRASLQRRRFRSGQIRVADAGGMAQRALWRGIGAVQFVLHAQMAAVAGLLGQRRRAEFHRGQAWGGLGKLFWRRPQPPFYGDDPLRKDVDAKAAS